MLFSPAQVTATTTSGGPSRPHEGIGRVARQLDSSTYVIALGKDTVTMKVAAHALSVGDMVALSLKEGGWVVERLEPSPPLSLTQRGDIFSPSGPIPSGQLAQALDSIFRSLIAEPCTTTNVQQCAQLFAAIANACSSVDPSLAKEIATALDALVSEENSAVDPRAVAALVRELGAQVSGTNTAGMDDRSMLVNTLLPEGLYAVSTLAEAIAIVGNDERLTQRLVAAFTANSAVVLRTVPLDMQRSGVTLLTPEDVRGELTYWNASLYRTVFAGLSENVLERLLFEHGFLPLDRLRLIDAFVAAMQQPVAPQQPASPLVLAPWIDAAVSSRAAASSLAARIPVFSAASLASAADHVLLSGPALPSVPLPHSFDAFGITAESLRAAADPATLLDKAVSALGLTLERTLAQRSLPDQPSFKLLMLRLLQTLDRTVPEAPLPEAVAREAAEFRVALETALDRALPAAVNDPTSRTALLYAMRSTLPSGLSSTNELVRILASEAVLLGGTKDTPSNVERTPVPPHIRDAFIRDARGRIDAALRTLWATLESALRNILSEKTMSSAVEPGVRSLAATIHESFWNTLFPLVEEAGRHYKTALETALRAAANGAAPQQHGTADGVFPKDQASDTTAFDRATVRHTVEQLIHRVESLQILARQTPTATGDQQIIALPVKIGDAWTEMRVRFVRQRPGRGAEGGRHFTVYLDVAPATLGAVGARFDYHPKKSLTLFMEFERDAARQWFADQTTALADALRALGVPWPRIECRLLKKTHRTPPDATTAGPDSERLLDVKA